MVSLYVQLQSAVEQMRVMNTSKFQCCVRGKLPCNGTEQYESLIVVFCISL
jgi:hypothetical protein